MAAGDAADLGDWESRCMELHFSLERLCQAVLATENPTAIKRLSEWLRRYAALATALHDSVEPPEVAA